MAARGKIMMGILVSVLLTAPLTAIFYVGRQAADLPFVPTNLMDWLIPIIPGDFITFSIDTMVDIIIALKLGREDTVAKFAEGWTAVLIFASLLIVLGTLYYYTVHDALKRWRNKRLTRLPLVGLGWGLLLAIPLAVISNYELTAANPFYDGPSLLARSVWIIAVVGVWGIALQLVFNRFTALSLAEPASEATDTTSDTTMTFATPAQPVTTAAGLSTASSPGGVELISRRRFLIQLGGATATITVLGAGLGRLLTEKEKIIALDQAFSFKDFPNTSAAVVAAPGTRPEYTPLDQHYRIDINSGSPPEIDGDLWRLTFKGLVAREVVLTLTDLQKNYEPMHQYVTLACISNRIGGNLTSTTGWTGASLREVLKDVPLLENATHLKISSADGFWEVVDLELVRSEPRVMLTYAWDGELLRIKHGFPLRIYIPDRYGMKQPKWITEIEALDEWEPGYWVQRSWDREAIMRTTSVVDTVAVDHTYEKDGGRFVPVGGIAHAGARGISKVEVRVDDGEWVEAQLRQPLSATTWVIWRYDWPFAAGEHTFAVRCYDGKGELQIAERNTPHPSGATGIHTRSATL